MAKKVREVIEVLERNGWREARRRGSHRQFRHPVNRSVVTVAGNLSDTIPAGTLARIRRTTGIEGLR